MGDDVRYPDPRGWSRRDDRGWHYSVTVGIGSGSGRRAGCGGLNGSSPRGIVGLPPTTLDTLLGRSSSIFSATIPLPSGGDRRAPTRDQMRRRRSSLLCKPVIGVAFSENCQGYKASIWLDAAQLAENRGQVVSGHRGLAGPFGPPPQHSGCRARLDESYGFPKTGQRSA
jgi:hypothetical protein